MVLDKRMRISFVKIEKKFFKISSLLIEKQKIKKLYISILNDLEKIWKTQFYFKAVRILNEPQLHCCALCCSGGHCYSILLGFDFNHFTFWLQTTSNYTLDEGALRV